MLKNALKYASLGLKVFPIREGVKNPATSNGFHAATTDILAINKWWGENPKYNIAIRTGKESGIFSLDVDCKSGKNGFLWLNSQGDLPDTVIQNTPSGGKQFIFKMPEFSVTCNSEKLAEGIDIRGENGYILVPPSKLIETPTYKFSGDYFFMTEQGFDEIEVAQAPDWLLEKLLDIIPVDTEIKTEIREDLLPIDIKKVMDFYKINLPEVKKGVFQGAHPIHGSSNGANFKIDTNKNVWACYRHTKDNGMPVGGGVLQLIAMMEGIIPCEKCAKGALRGAKYNKVVQILNTNFNVGAESIKKEALHPMYEIATDIRDGALGRDYIYCVEDDNYYFYEDNFWQGSLEGELALVMNRKISYINKNSLSMKNQIFGHLRVEVQRRLKCFNATKCLNFKEGEYSAATNILTPHKKENYSTTRLSYPYDPDAKCPLWIKTLNEIFENNQNKVNTLQEFFGYCLTSEMQLKKALLLLGESDTGKSTVLFIFKELIGEINYSNVSLKNIGHPQYTPMMINKLVNIDTDVDKNAAEYEANFKKITAYEEIECNQKYVAAFRFRPECRIILSANIFPKITDHSSAFYNRLIIIPFDRIFAPEEQDSELVSKLRSELSGIFNWCIEGYQRLKERKRFEIYDFSKEAVEELEDTNNPSNLFFKEHIEVDMGSYIEKGELFDKYKQWSELNKQWTLSAAMFSNCVYKTFHKSTPKQTSLKGKRIWQNIKYVNFKNPPEEDKGYTE